MDEDAPMAAQTESDYKKQEKVRAAKIKELYKEYPDNAIIKEMNDDILQQEAAQTRKGPSPMSYIHEAVWAAEDAYQDGDVSFSKVCADLIEAIDACSKFTDDSKQFASNGSNKPKKATTGY